MQVTLRDIKFLAKMIHNAIPESWDVNSGGCGFYALYLHNALKNVGIKSRIALFEEEATRSTFFQTNRETGTKQPADHIMLRICMDGQAIYVDSDGWSTLEGAKNSGDFRTKCVGFYSVKSLEYALKYGRWNFFYNRVHNKEIQSIIDEMVSRIFGQTTKIAA